MLNLGSNRNLRGSDRVKVGLFFGAGAEDMQVAEMTYDEAVAMIKQAAKDHLVRIPSRESTEEDPEGQPYEEWVYWIGQFSILVEKIQ